MDLNQLFHLHQTALIGTDAAPCGARRDAAAQLAREVGAVIAMRQRELGATFLLLEVKR